MEQLRSEWNTLYRETLPSMAKARDSHQKKWPVTLDHCFARIILDNAVGKNKPWADVVKAPAAKNMTEPQITAALDLGKRICEGDADLVELDQRSFDLRGKTKRGSTKRKNEDSTEVKSKATKKDIFLGGDTKRTKENSAPDIRQAFQKHSKSSPKTSENKEEELIDVNPEDATSVRSTGISNEELEEIYARIRSDNSLSPYRKQILMLLAQVPRGRFTYYKSLGQGWTQVYGTGKINNARAVGAAMRNNPFAPVVPCHRVIAADNKIGGFGGDWGEDGKHANEKVRLLREEGVKFDSHGKAVGQAFTGFYDPELSFMHA